MVQLQYNLIRSSRRSISLQVERDGTLTVRAPQRMSQVAIETFVTQKAVWISQTRRKVAAEAAAAPALRVAEGACLPWLDGTFTLSLGTQPKVQQQGDVLFLPQTGTEQALEGWCRRQAREHLTQQVARLAPLLGVTPTGIHVTGARGRWGSCSGRNSLNFSWRLLLCPEGLVEYVVVHELAHIREKNHSPAFWALVAAVFPDLSARRAALRHRRWVMDFL